MSVDSSWLMMKNVNGEHELWIYVECICWEYMECICWEYMECVFAIELLRIIRRSRALFLLFELIFSPSLEENWEKITLLWWSIAILLLRKIKVQWTIDLWPISGSIQMRNVSRDLTVNCDPCLGGIIFYQFN